MTQPDSRSPWAGLQGVDQLYVGAFKNKLDIDLTLPGSKSVTNRALILAAVADGKSILKGILKSDDSYWCIETLKQLGVAVDVRDDGSVHIDGCKGQWPVKNAKVFVGSAGTTARFLPGFLAAAASGDYIMDGSAQLQSRPIDELVDALRVLGAKIGGEHLPLHILGGGLHGGSVGMSGATSSQFISGFLMAAPYAKGPVTLTVIDHIVQADYVLITTDLMKQFDVRVDYDQDLKKFHVDTSLYKGKDFEVEADASTATYFMAMAAVLKGRVRINNLGYQVRQPDIKFIDVLEKMGCKVIRDKNFIEVVGPDQLKGGFSQDMKPLSDATLTLAAIAPFADAPIEIYGVAHIRKHESDRIHVMCEALAKLGIQVEERDDGMKIYPGEAQTGVMETHDDHRVVMALAVLGMAAKGITLKDPGAVSKTCPTFFDILKTIGVEVNNG